VPGAGHGDGGGITTTSEKLPALRPLAELNRAQPKVQISLSTSATRWNAELLLGVAP